MLFWTRACDRNLLLMIIGRRVAMRTFRAHGPPCNTRVSCPGKQQRRSSSDGDVLGSQALTATRAERQQDAPYAPHRPLRLHADVGTGAG